MSGPVDVLAVLDDNAAHLEGWSVCPLAAGKQREARAAVAELIEAAQEARAIHGFITFALDVALARIGGAA